MEPTINPLTNRRIRANGPTYNKLQSACGNTKSQEHFSNMPCYIRKCSHIKYKPDIMEASPSRKRLLNAVRPANTSTWTGLAYGAFDAVCGRSKILSQVREFYDRWNLCEAPVNLDFSHVAANTLYLYLAEYLHVLYGDVVVPGMLHLDSKSNFNWYSEFLPKPKAKAGQETFSDVITRVKQSPMRMHVALTIVENADGVDAHAMVMVFNKTNGNIALEIIDPYMQHESLYSSRLRAFLNTTTNKKHSQFRVMPHYVNRNLMRTFQSAESMMMTSSLDFWGYCGVWTVLMMELIASGARGDSNSSAQDILAHSVPFKSASPAVWRKLALDYIFSRIADLYAVSAIFMYTHVHDFLDVYVARYVDKINEQEMYNAIMRYIPWFDDEVHDRLP